MPEISHHAGLIQCVYCVFDVKIIVSSFKYAGGCLHAQTDRYATHLLLWRAKGAVCDGIALIQLR